MASVTILHGHHNLWIAHAIAQQNDGEVREHDPQGFITVEAPKRLQIARAVVEKARGKAVDDHAWQSFALNKRGKLTKATATEIVIED
jgi:predicted alpha-1,6-mannanase (GH76 family)